MLVTEMAKTVTKRGVKSLTHNILKLSPTHFVSTIRHQHRCSPNLLLNLIIQCVKNVRLSCTGSNQILNVHQIIIRGLMDSLTLSQILTIISIDFRFANRFVSISIRPVKISSFASILIKVGLTRYSKPRWIPKNGR